MPQLDGLRTLAVSAVLAQHYHLFEWSAGYGVHLFFVLSGFLITGILLGERRNVDELGIARPRAFRQFYIRRSLRIFPLYYFVVLPGILLNVTYARQYAPWLLTYTINWKMAAQGWYIDNFSHFWSLAIEEQYYLVWPWLILLLPRRWLGRTAIAAIIAAPAFRFLVLQSATSSDANALMSAYIATPTALDSLGAGSLLAILTSTERGSEWLGKWMRFAIPLAGLALVCLFQFGTHGRAHSIFLDTAVAIFFSWLIYKASRGFSGIFGKILSLAPIVYLGRISYGIYVYHPLIPAVLAKVAHRLGIQLPAGKWISAIMYAVLTIGAATISWYVLERPMNQLKRYFPYRTREGHSPSPAIP